MARLKNMTKDFGSQKGRIPAYFPIGCPDVDNLDKAVYDALKGIIWKDDTQIVAGSHEKFYAALGETPFAYVRVSPY